MIEPFKMGYTVLGGLGIFILGMKYLSDSLQMLSGGLIRKAISSLTTNRILAVLVGLTVTAFVQSSSITTVMVVGLTNAGLMQLSQAIGVILGANIGTTITGWILAVNIGKYGLLLIALGIFPMLFSKNERISATAKVLVALGMIFFGLEIMSGAFKPLRSHEGFMNLMLILDGPVAAESPRLRRHRLPDDHGRPEQFGDARHHHCPGDDGRHSSLHGHRPGHGRKYRHHHHRPVRRYRRHRQCPAFGDGPQRVQCPGGTDSHHDLFLPTST
jgi:hypothetical protein